MPLTLTDIKKMVDIDYDSGYETRIKASNDRVFYFITQIDDWLINNSQLGYLGEFDLLRKCGRQILSDLAENPVQLDFNPVDLDRQDGADILDGMYRTDDNNNLSITSYENAKTDQVVCGVGAWELYTDYSSRRDYNDKQVIRRRPLMEAVNTVLFDANAVLLDKADATRVTTLVAYTEEGYREYVSEMTGEDEGEVRVTTFKQPEHSYSFPWYASGKSDNFYIGNFYHTKKVKTKILTMVDPLGEERQLMENQLFDVMDELIDEGWEEISSKEIETNEVRKYVVSGSEILNGGINSETGEREGEVIAGEFLPVIPVYGEYTIVEGEEHYEGFVRLAKDPQRLRNFLFNYIADIASRSPRPKPIYAQEQIAKFEHMYAETGADDNYAYRLQNLRDSDGRELPLGPLGMTPDQPIPQALAALIPLTRESVEDVAPSMLPKEISDPSVQIANKTVQTMQASISEQSTIYQQHFTIAKRRDGEVYASMAAEIYDVPRKVTLTLPDGTRKEEEIMSSVIDEETGKVVVLNDLNNAEFRVTAKIGPAYTSQKEQTVERMIMLMQGMVPGDPKRNILELKILESMDGVDLEDLRDYSRKELILMGIKEPDTDEEKAMLEEAKNKPEEPSAEMVLAQGELLKGQAAKEKNQIEMAKAQANAQNEQMKRMIDEFKAATDRMNTQVDAQEAGATINYKRVDTMGKELDNAMKAKELGSMSLAEMSDEDLFKQMTG